MLSISELITPNPKVKKFPPQINTSNLNTSLDNPFPTPATTPTTIFPLYSCQVCHKSFKRPVHLKSHQKVHEGKKPFKCGTCHLQFLRKHDLSRHERIHAGIRPHVCDRCGKAFARKDGLKRHVNMDPLVKKFRCPVRNLNEEE